MTDPSGAIVENVRHEGDIAHGSDRRDFTQPAGPPILATLGWTKSTAPAAMRRSNSIRADTFSQAAIGSARREHLRGGTAVS